MTIIPAGTAFDGTHTWVVTGPTPGGIEPSPNGTFPAGRNAAVNQEAAAEGATRT
jgi:hypothetical protein